MQETQVQSLSRKIPHAKEQLSLYTTTTEPVLQSLGATTTEPMCCNYWSLHNLEPQLCSKKSPGTATREKPLSQQLEKACAAMKTQRNQN